MQQKLFQFLFATPKIEKIYILYIYRKYLVCLQSNTSGSFLQKCLNFSEQQLTFSHFEDLKFRDWGFHMPLLNEHVQI